MKQLDTDGGFQYSETISITNAGEEFNYFVQQTNDELIISSVQFMNSDFYFEIFDITGKHISNYVAPENASSVSVNLQDLLPGFYLLQAKTKMGEGVFTHSFCNYR